MKKLNLLLNKIHQVQGNEIIYKLGYYAFWLATIIEVLLVILDKSAYNFPYQGRVFQITFLLCFIKVLCTKYEWSEYIAIFICCSVGLLADQMGDKNEILRMFMFVAACKDIDMKKCMKVVFWITSLGSLSIVIMSILGIGRNITELKEYAIASADMKENLGVETYSRFSFGMGHPNTFHIMVAVICILGLYVYKEVINWKIYLLVMVADIALYYLTDARTPTIIIMFSSGVMCLVKYIEKWKASNICLGKRGVVNQHILDIFSVLGFFFSIICVELSFWFAANAWKIYEYAWSRLEYSKSIGILRKIDIALSGRIMNLMNYNNRAGSIWTWKLLPDSSHTEMFDLGYVRLFYWYGTMVSIFIILIFVALFAYLVVEEKYTDVMFISIIAIFTFVEAHFVSEYIGRNYLLFILGMYWVDMLKVLFERKSKKTELSV